MQPTLFVFRIMSDITSTSRLSFGARKKRNRSGGNECAVEADGTIPITIGSRHYNQVDYAFDGKWNSLQGVTPLPAGLSSVSKEYVAVIPRNQVDIRFYIWCRLSVQQQVFQIPGTIQVPAVQTLTLNVAMSGVEIPLQAMRVSTTPYNVVTSPGVSTMCGKVIVSNTLATFDGTVRGVTKSGTIMNFAGDLSTNIRASCPIAKNFSEVTSACDTNFDLAPDAMQPPNMKYISVTTLVPNLMNIIMNPRFVGVVGLAFTQPTNQVTFVSKDLVPYCSYPYLDVADPTMCVLMLIAKFTLSNGVTFELVSQPIQSYGDMRPVEQEDGVWVATLCYSTNTAVSPAALVQWRPTMQISTYGNIRLMEYSGLNLNVISVSGSGVAAAPVGDTVQMVYSSRYRQAMDPEKEWRLMSQSNSATTAARPRTNADTYQLGCTK